MRCGITSTLAALIVASIAGSAGLSNNAMAQQADQAGNDRFIADWMAEGRERLNEAVREFGGNAGKPSDWGDRAPAELAQPPSAKADPTPVENATRDAMPATVANVPSPAPTTTEPDSDSGADSSGVEQAVEGGADPGSGGAAENHPSDEAGFPTRSVNYGGSSIPGNSDEYIERDGDLNSPVTGPDCSGVCTAQ